MKLRRIRNGEQEKTLLKNTTGLALALTALTVVAYSTPLKAADPEYRLAIQDHRFSPEETIVPAGKRLKLVIKNADASPEEFESHELKREKIIPGNSTATIYFGPLGAGTYPFVGEFHEKTAKGRLVAR